MLDPALIDDTVNALTVFCQGNLLKDFWPSPTGQNRHTFLAYLMTSVVEERCKNGLPETTHVTSLINTIKSQDVRNYLIKEIYQTNMNTT